MQTNYSVGNSMPQAFVTVNKSRKKIINSQVYLKSGSNFEIEIFNPLQKSVMAKISINGVESSNGLVLKPGQRYFLDRYLDEQKKFLFETYEVENSLEAKQAIQNNGLVNIKFYLEKQIIPKYIPPVANNFWYYNQANPFVGNNIRNTYGTCSIGDNLDHPISTYTTCSNVTVDNLSFNAASNNINLRYNTLTQDEDYFIPSRILNKSIETGIIGKGEKSKQNFDSIDMDFEYFTSNVITYKLLPESLKPFEIKDLKKSKNFCPSCSNKIENNNWKFCPNCQCKL